MKVLAEIERELLEEEIRELIEADGGYLKIYEELQYRGHLPMSEAEAAPRRGRSGLKSAEDMDDDELREGFGIALDEMTVAEMMEFRESFFDFGKAPPLKYVRPEISERMNDYSVKVICYTALGFIILGIIILIKIILKS